MSGSSSIEFTASDGRRFAFPVAAAFFALAVILWWRDRPFGLWLMVVPGTLLMLGGIALPARLGPVYRGWMRMAMAISKVTTPIFMAIVYYAVFTPAGQIMRLLGKRPIEHRSEKSSLWYSADHPNRDLRRQF